MVIVQNATLPSQRSLETTLSQAHADAEAAGVGAPAIVCVGKVALLRKALDWRAQAAGAAPESLDPLGVLGPEDSCAAE